ncbi:MAG: MFS transporter [Anaerolinea sp.]
MQTALLRGDAGRLLAFTLVFHIGFFGVPDVVLNFYYVSLGYPPEQIALFASLPRVAGLLSGIPIGFLGGRIGEGRVLLLSTVGSALAMLLAVLFTDGLMLAASRFLMGFFYGANQIVISTLMVRVVSDARANVYFSLFNIVGMIFMGVGNLLGGVLPLWIGGEAGATSTAAYAGAMLVSAGLVALSLLPLLGLPHTPHKRKVDEPRLTIPFRLLLILSLPMLTFGFTGGLTFPFYNLLFREVFALPDVTIGQLLGVGSLSMALVPMLNPWIARRLGRSNALSVLMIAAAAAFFVLGVASGAGLLFISVVAYVIAVGTRNTMQPLFQPLLLSRLPPELHNMGNSVASVVWNVGWFCATLISGFLQTRLGYPAIMLIVSAGVLLTAGVLYAVYRLPLGGHGVPQPEPS